MFEQWIPLLVAIFGGVGVKVLEGWLSKSGKKIDIEADIRKELREVVKQQDAKIEELMNEVDVWKQKYYKVLEDLLGYEQLKVAHTELKKHVKDLGDHAKTLPKR